MRRFRSLCRALIQVMLGALAIQCCHAQSLEPRNYTNLPVGMNFLIFGASHSSGGIAFDAALPVRNPELDVWTTVVAYAHAFEFQGQTGRIDLALPYAQMSGNAEYAGHRTEREQHGFTDSVVRLALNLKGAPPLTLPEFARFEPDLIIGTSLQITAPTGSYDPEYVVNLGTNRWSFKPELGLSKAFGPLSLELAGAVTLFTQNTNFYRGSTRRQDPLYSVQVHGVYNFATAVWASISATYYGGGRTYVNDVADDDRQENWRIGAAFSVPIGRHFSVKLSASDGVYARTGNNMSLLSLALQTRWGGGL